MKTFKLGPITLKNRYIMAPLAGYTNHSFRKIVSNYGASLAYTEMISSSALVYDNKKTLTMLPKDETIPVALQLFGGKLDVIKKSIEIVDQQCDFDFLDFNMGCPVPKVMKQFSGSYWLKRQDEFKELFEMLVKTSKHPVLIKTRIGFDDNHKNVLDLVKIAADSGITAVAIHGRTKTQLYSGQVNYDIIKEAVDLNLLPIIANGDIGLENFKEVEQKTNAPLFMFGREALGHPLLFKNLENLENNLPIIQEDLKTQANLLKQHYLLLKEEFSPINAIQMIKGVGAFYFKGLSNSSKIRSSIVKIQNEKDLFNILDEITSL